MLDTNNFNVDKSNDFILLEPNGINHIQQFHNQKLGTNGQSEMHVKQGDILHYSLEYQLNASDFTEIVEDFDEVQKNLKKKERLFNADRSASMFKYVLTGGVISDN